MADIEVTDGREDIIQGFKPMLDLLEKGDMPRHMFEKWLAGYIQDIRRMDSHRWTEEIGKRLPGIDFMSFAGAESTVAWVFERVEIKDEDKA